MGMVSKGRCLIVVLVCVVSAYTLALSGLIAIPLGAPGSRDFVQYWSAWQLISRGLNPYDPGLMRDYQGAVSRVGGEVTMMWNPPWTPTLLAPALALPFEHAAALWLIAQLGMAFVIAVVIPKGVGRNVPVLLSALIVLSFLPVLDTLYWGQIALLLTLGATLFVYFEERGKSLMAGVALVPLTLKPHLMICILPAGVLWWWRLSRANKVRFLMGFLGGLVFLCSITATLAPRSLSWWLAAVMAPSSGVGEVPTVAWKTATVTTWLRIFLSDSSQGAPVWPMLWLPMVTLVGVTIYYAYYKPVVLWRTTLPALVGLSLLVGPYGWLYDQSILLVGLVAVASDALSYQDGRDKIIGLAGVFAVGLLALVQSCAGYNQQHYYVWIPMVILCLLAFNRRCLRKSLIV